MSAGSTCLCCTVVLEGTDWAGQKSQENRNTRTIFLFSENGKIKYVCEFCILKTVPLAEEIS